ncbi:MAG: hypothetical protein ABL868_08470, partial [Sulfuriferula sp.]
MQHYGEAALAKTQGTGSWLSGLGDKARHAYQCATSDAPAATPPVAAPVSKLVVAANDSAAPCCPACPPCATTPPYMDFGSLYGRNAPPPIASVDAPAVAVTSPAPTTATPPAPGSEAATAPSNYPAYAGMSQPVAPAPAPAPAVVAPPLTTLAAPVVSKDMLRARNWVSQKKYDYAIIAYKKHIAAHPDDVNGYGEIGNAYLLAKHYPQAAQSFYEAANRLLDAGYVDAVLPMLPVITQYQPQLASQLKSKQALMGK